jgi:hypothetical protein
MIGPGSGHGWGPLQPLLALLLSDPETAMTSAEVVPASRPVHSLFLPNSWGSVAAFWKTPVTVAGRVAFEMGHYRHLTPSGDRRVFADDLISEQAESEAIERDLIPWP